MYRVDQSIEQLLFALAKQIETSAASCDEIVKTVQYLAGDPLAEAPMPPDLSGMPSDQERRATAREWHLSAQSYTSKFGVQTARCERILDIQRQ